MPSLVDGDVFVPPFGAVTPNRHYFLFGEPIATDEIDPNDGAAVAAAYAQLKGRVLEGLLTLQDEVRPADPYANFVRRTAWEGLYDTQAPGPPAYK